MTLPRRVIPGSYLVQRRVVHRRFYLRPSAQTDPIFLYCLGYAVLRTGVELHEFMLMSNHYHLVLSDPHCRLPLFQQILNSFVARAMNSELGLSGTYWEREPYSAPATEGDDDVVDRCVYVLTNPCRANLVERAEEWTGVSSYALEYGQPIFATRPGFFHDSMPEQVEIRLVRPRVMLELSDEDLRRHIRQRVRAVEAELAAERRRSGTRVLGMRRVRAQSIHDNPQRRETATKAQPRKPPRCRWSLVALAQRSYDWVAAYRKALKDWVADKTNVVFPAGTYLMRVRYGVACASP